MKLVIFDMDGLLVDSESIYAEGWKQGLAKVGYEVPNDLVEGLSGKSIAYNNKVMFDIVKDMDVVYEIRSVREKYFDDQLNMGNVKLMYYALPLMQFLKAHSIKIALATTTHKLRAYKILETNGILDMFDYICCGDEVENVKPSPDIYLNIVNRSNIEKTDILALEDSITGASAAIAANIPVAIVSKKINANKELVDDLKIQGVFETLEHIYLEYINKLELS